MNPGGSCARILEFKKSSLRIEGVSAVAGEEVVLPELAFDFSSFPGSGLRKMGLTSGTRLSRGF